MDAAEVIVSAGAVGSPQLLVLSGVGPAADIQAVGLSVVCDRPGVGRNLSDHPVARVAFAGRGPVPVSPTSHRVAVRLTAPGSSVRNDIRVQLHPSIDPRAGVDVLLLNVLLEAPVSSGRVTLSSADPSAEPDIDLRLLDQPADLDRMRSAVRFLLCVVDGSPFESFVVGCMAPDDDALRSDQTLDDWLRANVGCGYHLVGTCRMGPAGDPQAVIDTSGRVHGVERLRVVDASVMPTNIRANPNLSTVMIAERMTQRIAGGR